MASFSEMRVGMAQIAQLLVEQRSIMSKVKVTASNTSAALAAIPTTFADTIASINAIPANTTNTAELLLKADLAKMTTEYNALKTVADQIAAANLG